MALQRLKTLFSGLEVGTEVTREDVIKTAGIIRWFQRIDELRNQYGFSIQATQNGYIYLGTDVTKEPKKRVSPSARCKLEVFRRDCGKCRICGRTSTDKYNDSQKKVRLQYDHIFPHASGHDVDKDDASHWQLLCCRHNLIKRDSADYQREALIHQVDMLQDAAILIELADLIKVKLSI